MKNWREHSLERQIKEAELAQIQLQNSRHYLLSDEDLPAEIRKQDYYHARYEKAIRLAELYVELMKNEL